MKIAINIFLLTLLFVSCNRDQPIDIANIKKMRNEDSYRRQSSNMVFSNSEGSMENIQLSQPVQILVIPEEAVQIRIPDETLLTAIYYQTIEDTCYLGLNNGRPFRLRVYETFIIVTEAGMQTIYPFDLNKVSP